MKMDDSNSHLMDMESEMDENGSGAMLDGAEGMLSEYENPDAEGDEDEAEYEVEENHEDVADENLELEKDLPNIGTDDNLGLKIKSELPDEEENQGSDFNQLEIKQELSDYEDENAELEEDHLESELANPELDEGGSGLDGEHSEGDISDLEGEQPESENLENVVDNHENLDLVVERDEGAELDDERDDAEMEESDFDDEDHPELDAEDEHPELDAEDEEFDEGEYPDMDDEDSRLEGDENLLEEEGEIEKGTPLAVMPVVESNLSVNAGDTLEQRVGLEPESMTVSADNDADSLGKVESSLQEKTSLPSSVPRLSPKLEPLQDDDIEKDNPSSPSAFSIRKSIDLTRSLGTLDWQSSASPSKRDLPKSPPCSDHHDDPRPTKRLKMQTMRTELDLKGSMMTRTWTELTNILNDYQAELYQREDTITSFENGDEKIILEEMSTLKDDLECKDKLLSKCQEELRVKSERLKVVESDLLITANELNKVKQEQMTRNTQVKKFEFDIRYLKNEHTVKDNLLKKVQDQMVRETREMAAQIRAQQESMEMEKRLTQSYKDMMEREIKKRENAENRCRMAMSHSGGKVPVSMSASSNSDVIVIEDDEPHRANIRLDMRPSRLSSNLTSFRQTSPSSSLSSLGQMRRQSPVSSVHGSSIGGAQTSFMPSNNQATKTLSSSAIGDHKGMAPVIANVESLSGGLSHSGHSLSSLASPTKYEESIMNPLQRTPDRQDSFGEGSSMEMSQIGMGSTISKVQIGNDEFTVKVCSSCNKVFSSAADLKRHLLTHTGEKPFGCDRCGARFRQSGHLQTHVAQVHKEGTPETCPKCGKQSFNKYFMNKHKKMCGLLINIGLGTC